MKLVKSDFSKTIKLAALRVANKQIHDVLAGVNDQFLDIPNVKRVIPAQDDPNKKLLLLAQCLQKDTFDTKWPDNLKKKVLDFKLEVVEHELQIGFDNMTVNDILEKLLPSDVEVPQGYETVGHIAHFNLKPKQLPYGNLIGEVIIEKFKQIRTVVHKLEKLHNVYRTPELQLLAGEDNLETEHKEDKCILKLDFQKVYFCSRLHTERDRILKLFKPGQTVLDLFCGVGPLAIRAAKLGCHVIANDLNPACFDYLVINREANHVEDRMLCFNNDARKIVDTLISETDGAKYGGKYGQKFLHFDHVYMNLPVDNIEFCDVFKGLLVKGSKAIWNENNLPMIHATGFVSGEDDDQCKTLITERAKEVLPNFKKESIEHFVIIKNVTATKKMFCVSFRLNPLDALEEPAKYDYITPEREAESLPTLPDMGSVPYKKVKKE